MSVGALFGTRGGLMVNAPVGALLENMLPEVESARVHLCALVFRLLNEPICVWIPSLGGSLVAFPNLLERMKLINQIWGRI